MCRNLLTGERKWLEPPFWIAHGIDVHIAYGAVKVWDHGFNILWLDAEPIESFEFNVWAFHLDRLFGTSTALLDHAAAASDRPPPVQPEPNPRPAPKRKHGGGRPRKLSPEAVEYAKKFFREELRDPRWRTSSVQACSLHVNNSLKLGCHWETIAKWIVEPVLNEPVPASTNNYRPKN